jgi:hypothetical protein
MVVLMVEMFYLQVYLITCKTNLYSKYYMSYLYAYNFYINEQEKNSLLVCLTAQI